jgi:hypothetical protein
MRAAPVLDAKTRGSLVDDAEAWGREWRRDWPAHILDRYRIDLATEFLGQPVPHPIGKGSGQLSLRADQLEADASAGLAFTVLKTVIAQNGLGEQRMAAWAVHESRMRVERRRAADGREGWTVTWKGRGWDQSFEEYLALVRTARALDSDGQLLAIPSVKYHLPVGDEPFDLDEYAFTTRALEDAWGGSPLLLEKDFSPTLAGDARADERATVLRWLAEVPGHIRSAARGPVRLGLKLMNARFDDAFQRDMLAAAAAGADSVTVFNRLWDPASGVAYGGWDLSDRNLAVLGAAPRATPPRSGTGNITSGRMIVEYANRGCSTVQLHTFFQLPLSAYPAGRGPRLARALHALVFDPENGLLAALLELEAEGRLHRRGGVLHFRDLAHGMA